MNRDLMNSELTGTVYKLFASHMRCINDLINKGELSMLKQGCPAIDDELMLPQVNKFCGKNADFIYFYTLFTEDKRAFVNDRTILKDVTNTCLAAIRKMHIDFNGAELVDTNVISIRDSNADYHFICFLMKKEGVAQA